MPATGNGPPELPLSADRVAADLRLGLALASFMAAAKPCAFVLWFTETVGAAGCARAASFASAAGEIDGVAFIPGEIASDVPRGVLPLARAAQAVRRISTGALSLSEGQCETGT